MAFVSTFKAIEIAHELASKLTIRLAGALALVEGFDADGCPTIAIGAGSAGGKNVFIKLAAVDWALGKDSLGNAANPYGPEVVMFATEANPSAGAGADILDLQTLLNVVASCTQTGCQVQWYQSANGTAPVTATVASGNLKASFWPSAKWSITAAQ